jgi:hypothetical protein
MSSELFGIVVRFSDTFYDSQVDTIGEHNKLIKLTGTVFVGKFGTPMGKPYLEACCAGDSQIKLILVKRSASGIYKAYQAKIISAQKKRPSPRFIPLYLRKRTDIHCWFKINDPLKLIPKNSLNKWVTKSSGMPLIETLNSSMAGLFYAIYNKEEKYKPKMLNKPKGKGSKKEKDDWVYQIGASVEDDFLSLDEISFEDDDTMC